MKLKCNKESIVKASEIIKNGGIVVFPTDTVYGIGCNPYNKEAIKRIYKIKSREISKSFPILAFSKDVAAKIVEFDKDSEKIAQKIWPGPLTLILKSKTSCLQVFLRLKSLLLLVLFFYL